MQDDNTNQTEDSPSEDTAPEGNVIEPTLGLGTNPSDQPITDVPAATDDAGAQPLADDAAAAQQNDTQAGEPVESSSVDTADSSAETSETSSETEVTSEETTAEDSDSAPSGDLESIRSSALHELAPLVGELDQEPEEKYRTLMMMIQASDDQSLVKEAYETAGQIEDKKAKAKAC